MLTQAQRKTNHLIAVLSTAMGRIGIRGYFIVRAGVWLLQRNEACYSLTGLRGVTVTVDNQILLDLPGRTLILREEAIGNGIIKAI
jgi:hypothetical protein